MRTSLSPCLLLGLIIHPFLSPSPSHHLHSPLPQLISKPISHSPFPPPSLKKLYDQWLKDDGKDLNASKKKLDELREQFEEVQRQQVCR